MSKLPKRMLDRLKRIQIEYKHLKGVAERLRQSKEKRLKLEREEKERFERKWFPNEFLNERDKE